MPEGNKIWVLGDGVEWNYTWNTDWRCWSQRDGVSEAGHPGPRPQGGGIFARHP